MESTPVLSSIKLKGPNQNDLLGVLFLCTISCKKELGVTTMAGTIRLKDLCASANKRESSYKSAANTAIKNALSKRIKNFIRRYSMGLNSVIHSAFPPADRIFPYVSIMEFEPSNFPFMVSSENIKISFYSKLGCIERIHLGGTEV